MPRTTWNGRRVTRAIAYVVARDNGRCWLCGHNDANSLDHVIPASVAPHLEWNSSNWRAAHLTQAGTADGCQHDGCTCIGNKKRKAQAATPPPSRRW